jgi:hypothetical protein
VVRVVNADILLDPLAIKYLNEILFKILLN